MNRIVKAIVVIALFATSISQLSCMQVSARGKQTPPEAYKDYEIILQDVNPLSPNSDESFRAFETKVKKALSQGWNLVGGAVDLGGYISQTVAR